MIRLCALTARIFFAAENRVLQKESPDIVVLCSRHPGDHLPLIELAAAKGCHIYCEKPLAATLDEADRIAILHEGRIIANGTLADLKKLFPPAKVEYVEKQPTLEEIFLAIIGKKDEK